MTRSVYIDAPQGPRQLARAAGLLSRVIDERSSARSARREDTDLVIRLSTDTGVPSEGYRISAEPDGGTHTIAAAGDRGLIYGVGKYLRGCEFGSGRFSPSTWRGTSAPAMPIRGIYFATHFGNYYESAPVGSIARYIEELALWGCNALMVWFDMHQYCGLEDPRAEEMIERLHGILQAANDVGTGAGLLFLANEGFADSPEHLRVTHAPLQYDVEICPSRPGGLDHILEKRRQVLARFADLDLDYVCIWPHDQGGCGCETCNPWGARGFAALLRELRPLVGDIFPDAKVIASTWCFDRDADGEYAGLWNVLEVQPELVDYLMVDAHEKFPPFVLEHGLPAAIPMLNFTEISMKGMLPWGGYGISPLPKHIDQTWQPSQHLLQGGFPYSEGIYEDINKAMLLQRYWSPERDLESILHEYAAYTYSATAAVDMGPLLASLEPDPPLTLAQPIDAGIFGPPAELSLQGSTRLKDRPFYDVPDLASTADRLDRIEPDLPNWVRASWRWRILRIRANLHRELTRSGGRATEATERCFSELTGIYCAENAGRSVHPPSLDLIRRVSHVDPA